MIVRPGIDDIHNRTRVLKLIMEFNDFEAFSEYIKTLSEEMFCVFTIQDARTVEAANRKVAKGQKKYDPKFKYSYVKFGCKHYGRANSTSTGIRPNQRTFKTGCPCFLFASVDRKKDKLVIIKSNLEHNHDTNKELFMLYPEKRRLNEDQKKFIEELKSQQVAASVICQRLEEVHGKRIYRKDVQNLLTQNKLIKSQCDDEIQVPSALPRSVRIIRSGDTLTSVDSNKHVSHTISNAVKALEDELKVATDSISANIKSAENLFPKLFYTTSLSDVYEVIESYEVKTNSNFIVCEESENFGQNEPLHKLARLEVGNNDSKKFEHRIVWEDCDTSLAMYERFPLDHVPYIQLGKKIFVCHQGLLREEFSKETSKRSQKTARASEVDCTARICLREIHKFPEFKMEEGHDSDHNRYKRAKQIRKAIRKGKVIGERRIYVSLPSIADHSNHHVTEVDNFLTDLDVKQEIYKLVYQDILTVDELKEKTKEFVEKELFRGSSHPSLTDRRYYPSDEAVKNICHLARLKKSIEDVPNSLGLQQHRNGCSFSQAHCLPQVANEVTVTSSNEPTNLVDLLEEVSNLSQQVSDGRLLEEVRQNVLYIRKRLKGHFNGEPSQKRRRLDEGCEDVDYLA